ncbi:MAG TPA: cyclic nucleotide-binding domain-containing protein [Thermodesulfobacteriaceae bacterium]|nr:cyclic nucleotide-binding domain-containing protein [Thermodesulfobacteriaceae bacterium]
MTALDAPSTECRDIRNKTGFFVDCNASESEKICSYFQTAELKAGDVLFREGETGDSMAFIISGKLAVKKETEFPGKYFILSILGPGSFVGEYVATAETKNPIHNATVAAAEDTVIAILSRNDFNDLLEKHPGAGIKLLKTMLHAVAERLNSANRRLAMVF